jgi:hypothetical protein
MQYPLGDLLCETIQIKSRQNGLPEPLVRAICIHEPGKSVPESQRWFATRFEPHYKYLWDCENDRPYPAGKIGPWPHQVPTNFSTLPGLILSAGTEFIQQKTSWGPMQVMGAVARELGFTGLFPELCGPLGVYYGCLHLKRLANRFLPVHGWEGVAAAFNAGTPRRTSDGRWENQRYVDALRAVGCDFRTL